MRDNKKIAVNTVISYVRLLAIMALSLFSTRYILLALGQTDFGLYNLIAGVVFLFSFIANTMATTTQRFISFTMGKEKEIGKVRGVFYNSLALHLIIAITVAIIIQIGGQLIIKYLLEIPYEKIDDAYFALATVTIGIVGTVITVPFEAVLMAHENIFFVSLCQLFNSIIKFVIALSVMAIESDRLRTYAVLIAIIPYIQFATEWLYCHRKYIETRFTISKITDFSVIRHIGAFASWVMIGTTCGTIRQQGSSILLNMFFGIAINAANGIATQVNGVLMQFSSSITTAIRPQLVKSAGEGDKDRMLSVTYIACKFPFILTGILAVPLIVAMPTVLQLWLKNVPEYTVTFCRLLLISAVLNQSTIGMTVALEAYGKVKLIHSVIGLSFLLVIPAGYILFLNGMPPGSVIFCIVINEAFAAISRLVIAKIQLGFSVWEYIKKVGIRCILIVSIAMVIDYVAWKYLPSDFIGLVIIGIITLIVFSILTYFLGLTKNERNKVNNIINKTKRHFIFYEK